MCGYLRVHDRTHSASHPFLVKEGAVKCLGSLRAQREGVDDGFAVGKTPESSVTLNHLSLFSAQSPSLLLLILIYTTM